MYFVVCVAVYAMYAHVLATMFNPPANTAATKTKAMTYMTHVSDAM